MSQITKNKPGLVCGGYYSISPFPFVRIRTKNFIIDLTVGSGEQYGILSAGLQQAHPLL
jgi:hypothetical protein